VLGESVCSHSRADILHAHRCRNGKTILLRNVPPNRAR